MLCSVKPERNAGGELVNKENNEWAWEKVKWTKCHICNFYHSNRKIPEQYWDREWIVTTKFREKVGIVFIRGNCDIWITESYHGCYGFPKGEKELHESTEECAKREFKEETGHSIDNINLKKCLKLSTNIEEMTYTFFVVRVSHNFDFKTFPIDDVEITSCGWVNIDLVSHLKLSKAVRKIFNIFMKRYDKKYKKYNKMSFNIPKYRVFNNRVFYK